MSSIYLQHTEWNPSTVITSTTVLDGHDSCALPQTSSVEPSAAVSASSFHLSQDSCPLRLFSWLLAIGFFLLVFNDLDLGSPCSKENADMRIPDFYQPMSK